MKQQVNHDEAAHAHLGFCAQCPGYSWAAEATGWRTYAKQGSLGRWLYPLVAGWSAIHNDQT